MNNQIQDTRIAFFTQHNARPDYLRSVLSTAWKMIQLDDLTRHKQYSEWDEAVHTLANSIDYAWVEDVLQCRQLDVYYRRILGAQRVLMALGANCPVTYGVQDRQDDETLDHLLISDFWDNSADILELSSGERVAANQVYTCNADMYKPYATINGKKVPVLSLMHMGL